MATEAPLNDATTIGHLFRGRIVFEQPVEGYRAPVDGLLLASFAGATTRVAADLGAGAGMVTLALLAREHAPEVIAIERDPRLATILQRNVDANHFGARVRVLADDVEAVARARRGSIDLVVANPPFWRDEAATSSAHAGARSARQASGDGALRPFLRAARGLLARGGRACFVWPAGDLEALLDTAARQGLHAKRAQFVHPRGDAHAQRVLVEFKPGRPGGMRIEAPLVLADGPAALDGLDAETPD